VYTGGQTSGTATFAAPLNGGPYVARAYLNDTNTLLAESAPFTITSATVSTNQSSYAPSTTVTVTYAGLPGNANDWIALAPAGSPATTHLAWMYTGGQTSGTATFTAPLNGGPYVARAYLNDTNTLLAESAPFTITSSTVSTDQSNYAPGAPVTVTYAGLPGNAKDWISIAPAGSPSTTFVAWVYTGGQTSGTATFTAPLTAGSYVARAFLNDAPTLLAESAPFTVTSPTISTNQSSYAPSSIITVTYAGLPGNAKDWISIAPAGSPETTFVAWVYTGGQTSGTATFAAPVTAGSYVARAFLNDAPTLLAESAPFTVTNP
jgi:hypothetical protein